MLKEIGQRERARERENRKEEKGEEERFGTVPALIKCRVTLWATNSHMFFIRNKMKEPRGGGRARV